ncbi:hypothetical protein FGIG_05279 [Fasciola gigantica]|uniref:UPF0506 domain-containing protein n=1 Tax=Fasciola gigantica TaxID=46835 RepID=A0A504Y849_FASGI|nr:hypothetical protein FGIG_05279 [Fasciola gigantica]
MLFQKGILTKDQYLCKFFFIGIILIQIPRVVQAFWSEDNMPCKNLDSFCRKLPLAQRCCGDTVCQLHGIFKGTCVRCLKDGAFCFHSSECCGGRCYWLFCR